MMVKRQRKGDLARTTEALYGPCLHNYTIKEALQNKAVLSKKAVFRKEKVKNGS